MIKVIITQITLMLVLLTVSAFAYTNLGNAYLSRALESTMTLFGADFEFVDESIFSKSEITSKQMTVNITVEAPEEIEVESEVTVEEDTVIEEASEGTWTSMFKNWWYS